ncbi:MAG TPA: 30S ribosomal protein S6 [Dehalococcoidales bacterium]|nr:30S ribosomal protein S6 [Dehalococcoidales bacterium]
MARKKQETKPAEDTKLHDYELVVIVSPEVADDALESRVNTITQFITGREGVIGDVEKWGKRKLAYPLQHFLEGNYVLTRFKISPARCRELETNLKISEEILRHLLVRTDG